MPAKKPKPKEPEKKREELASAITKPDHSMKAQQELRRSKRPALKEASKANAELLRKSSNRSFGGLGRAVEPVPGSPTSSPQPTDKSYKDGTYRLHWKGERTNSGTSGNEPFVDSRDSKAWTADHDERRRQLSDHLQANVPGIQNPFGAHFAENSHIHAGSLFGTNDVLSAPPASIHQNTEWLAIESGIKHLQGSMPDRVRIKSTGYVHDDGPQQGTLKASRYKIYIDDKKVFDHVSMGARGNIDKDEYTALEGRVKGLTGTSPAANLHNHAPKGIHGTAPTKDDARDGQRRGRSQSHPQFTDLSHMEGSTKRVLTGQAAMDYATVKTTPRRSS